MVLNFFFIFDKVLKNQKVKWMYVLHKQAHKVF